MAALHILNSIVYAANEIARLLHHCCALNHKEAAEIPSIRALQAAWKAKGIKYNDTLRGDLRPGTCLEGWEEEIGDVFDHNIGGFKKGLIALCHRTKSGRMSVRVTNIGIKLRFFAGPGAESESQEGFYITELTFMPTSQVDLGTLALPLLYHRPDRLALLWKIDAKVFGGQISKQLEYYASSDWHYRQIEAANLVFYKSQYELDFGINDPEYQLILSEQSVS